MINKCKKVLIVSAHADDEMFGMGGTIFRLKALGCHLSWLIMSSVWTPRWPENVKLQRNEDIKKVGQFVGYDDIIQWDFPDNRMDDHPIDDYQYKLINLLNSIRPDTIFVPGPWDWNREHALAFEVLESSVKPGYSPYVSNIYSYEIPSSTDWGYKSLRQFPSAGYISIESVLNLKIQGSCLFTTEIKEFPHPRSPEGIQHYAAARGMEVGLKAAESFAVLRQIWK